MSILTIVGRKSPRAILLGCLISASLAATNAPAATAIPPNMDSALQKLYAKSQSTSSTSSVKAPLTAAQQTATGGRFDASNRVLVHVYLDGKSPITTVTTAIKALSGNVVSSLPAYRHGVLAAYLPIAKIGAGAKLPGVRALTMEHAPITRVGKTTAQSASLFQTDLANSYGLKGGGVTVGVISDSFDTNTGAATHAADDVKSGDLPVVNVIEDSPGGTDEGRAMCQVVHDEAPNSKLAFATAFVSELDFANNIVNLRTKAGASVIVDDVGYFDEPIFSDGAVADAVNTVATSTSLPGKPVVYLSSAGNDGNNGYRSVYRQLSDATVRKAGGHGNLKLISDPTSPNYLDPSLTAGGWFNWNTVGGSEPFTDVTAPGPNSYGYAIFLQWDDIFDQDHGVTSSFNFLVFDADGNYLPDLSSTANAFDYQQPIQGIGYLGLGIKYQIAITRSKQVDPLAPPVPANYHIALYTTLDGASTLEGTYFKPAPLSVPNIYGHPGADGAIAVAAYDYTWSPSLPYKPELENYSSPGPVTVYFDSNYNRIPGGVVRTKPEVAGADGLVTTFFGSPYYWAPYAFFGTSCAAPSVAGVAALVVQAAGGPGAIDPATVKYALEYSTLARNSTQQQTQATGSNAAGYVTVTAVGQSYNPNYLTVNYLGGPGNEIDKLVINGSSAKVVFDSTYFKLQTLSGIKASDITVSAPGTSNSITLTFKKGTFTSGTSIGFELGQDARSTAPGYTQDQFGVGTEAEDLAYGATFTATFGGGTFPTLTEPFLEGAPTYDYEPADGFGLIDGAYAIEFVLPPSEIPPGLQASAK